MGKRVKLEDNSGEQGGERVGKGASVKTGKITAVTDFSNYPMQEEKKTIGEKGFTPDLCLVADFKVDDFEKKLYVFGKFKRNDKGLITKWDSWNNNVQRLLAKLLGDQAEIEENLSIPPDVLLKLVGKEFKYVNYISNRTYQSDDGEKNSWQIWGKVFSLSQSLDEMIEEWNANLPYINDYAPEVLDSRDTTKDPWNQKNEKVNTMSAETISEESEDDII